MRFFAADNVIWCDDEKTTAYSIGAAFNNKEAEKMAERLNDYLTNFESRTDQPSVRRFLQGKLITSVRAFCEEADDLGLYGLELNKHYNTMRDTAEELANLEEKS